MTNTITMTDTPTTSKAVHLFELVGGTRMARTRGATDFKQDGRYFSFKINHGRQLVDVLIEEDGLYSVAVFNINAEGSTGADCKWFFSVPARALSEIIDSIN